MKIWNKSKNNLICQCKEAPGVIGRGMGLMFRKKLDLDQGLLIKFTIKHNFLHSFFMRFPIDVIFFDSNFQVVEILTLKPWKYYKPKKKCDWVLEVNHGTINQKNVEVGDNLEFQQVG